MSNKEIQGIWISEITMPVKELSWLEKALLEKMNLLDNSEKGCFASNQYLGNFLGVKKQSAANTITSLVKRNFLDRLWSDGHNRGYRSVLHHPELYSIEYGSNGKPYLKKYGSDEQPYSNEEGSTKEPYSKMNEPYSNEEGNHTQISMEPYSKVGSEPYSNEEHNIEIKDDYFKRDIDFKIEEISAASGPAKWNEILENLEKKLNPQIFDSWFKTIHFDGINPENKIIRLRSSLFNKDWVIKHYSDTFRSALESAGLFAYIFDWRIEETKFEVGNG